MDPSGRVPNGEHGLEKRAALSAVLFGIERLRTEARLLIDLAQMRADLFARELRMEAWKNESSSLSLVRGPAAAAGSIINDSYATRG